MFKETLLKRSPIRVLEKSIHGGVGKGNLGVFTARKGIGKTACLVHVAIDKMLRNQKVLHISFADDPHHIENWYREVFEEVKTAYKLQHAQETYEDLLHQRLIIHFKQKQINFDHIQKSIKQIENGAEFVPSTVIVDGCSFEEMTKNTMEQWKQFAQDQEVAIWFSATLHQENLQTDKENIPAPVNRFSPFFSVIIMLYPMPDHIDMRLLKDHDSTDLTKLSLKLDPKTLLISDYPL